jgi:hypothetical protein
VGSRLCHFCILCIQLLHLYPEKGANLNMSASDTQISREMSMIMTARAVCCWESVVSPQQGGDVWSQGIHSLSHSLTPFQFVTLLIVKNLEEELVTR